MKELPVAELPIDAPLDGYIFHSGGELLHRPGERLTAVHKALLDKCAIAKIIIADPTANPATVTQELSRKKIPLAAVSPDEPLPVTLIDAAGVVIVKAGDLLSRERKDHLLAGGLNELFYNKDPMERQNFQTDRYRALLDSDLFESYDDIMASFTPETTDTVNGPDEQDKTGKPPAESVPDERCIMYPAKMISVTTCKEMMQHPEMLAVTVSKTAAARTPIKITTGRSKENALAYGRKYADWISALDGIFASLKNNKETDFDLIDAVGVDIIECYYADCYYTLNCMNLRQPPTSDRYLPAHAINVAIAAAGMGGLLDYSYGLLRELVVGALLHDIGHLLTYRPLLAHKDLGSSEQQKYDNHAIVGISMLKNMTKIPISTMMIVAQHHEKNDGSGRIFHATAGQIHEFAKIIAALNYFENGCRFMNTSAALTSTIVEAQSGKLDFKYVKALVVLLSLYPVGIAVTTSKGLICKVIATNGTSFKTPVLRSVYTMSDGHLFPINKMELLDLQKDAITIGEEVVHSALKSDISTGFLDD
jgi:HD-GYP domain-containing protein (c-di-GMP phosphodiesterase class II)